MSLLEVHKYYFPLFTKRVIPLSEIRRIQDATRVSVFLTKSWGMMVDWTVYWACGMRSKAGRNGVGKVIAWTSKGYFPGFNVVNASAFLRQCQALELTVFESDSMPCSNDLQGKNGKTNTE
ncbi:hypothetical protein KIPB_002304 [Kipferlia bialata]|uniref:Uncharacterized protein n=1 Tax=Kipferlia bialata TaxID=797122 RepID=A0A9K3GG08_9EUKA|nr:hypothetical protein KIPB_002304 [Kipferlia bialata]|eukprot:g2304.t1